MWFVEVKKKAAGEWLRLPHGYEKPLADDLMKILQEIPGHYFQQVEVDWSVISNRLTTKALGVMCRKQTSMAYINALRSFVSRFHKGERTPDLYDGIMALE